LMVTASVDKIESVIKHALDSVDVIITTGGVSMGEKDMLKGVIQHRLGGTIHFGRVALKPGKPTTFSTIPRGNDKKIFFALPGNPVSAIGASCRGVLTRISNVLSIRVACFDANVWS
jgi:gephyrin